MNLDRMRKLLAEFAEVASDPVACDFNLLDLFDVGRNEVRHNKLLAWLLDPCGNHGQGPLFLKAFVEDVCAVSVPANVLAGCRTEAERRGYEAKIDVVVEREAELLIYVENKLDATEGDDQCGREFRDMVQRGRALAVPKPCQSAVFLTPQGDRPKSGDPDDWRPLSHRRLAEAFRSVLPRAHDPKLTALVEDWLAKLATSGRPAAPSLSQRSLFVGQHWHAAEQLATAARELRRDLCSTLLPLKTELSRRKWWSREWRFGVDSGTEPWVGHRSWRMRAGHALRMVVQNFVPDAVFGLGGPPWVAVWVDTRSQPGLAPALAQALAHGQRLRSDDVVELEPKDGTIVWHPLPQYSREAANEYFDDVRQQAMAFVDHHATVLMDLHDLIGEHLDSL